MEGSKSNKQGVGSEIELKQGNFYDKVLITGGPAYIYTGGLARLDVVRATWPTAIVENQLNVATNAAIRFCESERLARSCPLLYQWDGKRFVFVTDILSLGPLGVVAPDGTRIKPYPHEFVRRPSTLRQRAGAYEFQMTDELREVDYFDRLRLVAGADSRLVVMSTGDEMTVRFSAPNLSPSGSGWVRSSFLDASRYAKDGEPNTAYSATVTPLPFQGMSNYSPGPEYHVPESPPYRDYLHAYQTKPSYQLIPYLAPPAD